MSNVRRVYVEKKPSFAVKAKELKHEISSYLGIKTVTNVRELCPHCNMRSCCERDGTVEKLSVYCIEGCFHK